MTKKHTHEEYATHDTVSNVSVFTFLVGIVVSLIITVLVCLILIGVFRPTLTQLAKAEGWEIECLEVKELKVMTACPGFDTKELEFYPCDELNEIKDWQGRWCEECIYHHCTAEVLCKGSDCAALRRHD